MLLECFATTPLPPEIVPGRPQRAWMEAMVGRHAYRCLPLTMANCSGWEILCPVGFTAEWTGGPYKEDVIVTAQGRHPGFEDFVTSHFTHGILTFHPGYLFRTPPGWSIWTMGPPNHIKDGIQPLSGIVETDWLPYPFTMNWHFTRPGKVSFARGEPFCFITALQDKALEEFEVVQRPLESDQELSERCTAWARQRGEFNEKIYQHEPEAVKEAWQRHYFRGQEPAYFKEDAPDATAATDADHVNKRRLAAPVHRR